MNPPKPKPSILLRLLLVSGVLFLGLVFLVAVLFALENWRGHRAWRACQQELTAQGEKLVWEAFVPPEVPDDQNFATTPFFASMRFERGGAGDTGDPWPREYTDAQKEAGRLSKKSGENKAAPGERRLTDLAAWQKAFRKVRGGDDAPPASREAATDPAAARAAAAREVLEGLKVCEPIVEELRAASKRPQCRFPLQYDLPNPALILLPHLAKIKAAVTLLQIRTVAELAAGQNEAALEDVKLMLYLGDSIKDEPCLISQLVRIACFQITANAVWEGLATRQWTGAQLAQLQALLQKPDFLAGAQQALRSERAFGLRCIEYLHRAPRQARSEMVDEGASDLAGGFMTRTRWAIPSGWFAHEEANYARMFQELLAPDADVRQRRLDPTALAAKQRELEAHWRVPWKALLQHRIFGGLLLPALGNTYAKSATAQTAADQAVIASALERHRQANRQFPDTLEVLVPAFLDKLPLDVVTGEPMTYRRTADGQFLLYAVGWNGTDDGGASGKDGDWVWEYPAK